MSRPTGVRRLQPDDILYRKLNPGTWSESTREVADVAFVDQYPNQSFFLARLKSSQQVLEFFAQMRGVRKCYGGGRLTAKDLYGKRWGIAKIRVSDLKGKGFSIVPESNGDEFRRDGHVGVEAVRLKPHLISGIATALTEEEIFTATGQPPP
jgi:hypothetical protein